MLLALVAFYHCFWFLRFVTTDGSVRVVLFELIDVVRINFTAAAEVLVATSIAELATASAPTMVLAVIRHVAGK